MEDPTKRFVPGGFPTDLARRIVHNEDAGPQPDEMVRLQMALDAAESEIERLRKALNDAAGTGLIIYHIAKDHRGRARDCQEIGCGLQRNTMEGFVGGPIVWGD